MRANKPKDPRKKIEAELWQIGCAGRPDYGEVKPKDSLKALELLCRLNGLWAGPEEDNGQGALRQLMEGLREPGNPEERDDDL